MTIKSDFILKEIAGSFVVIPIRSAAADLNGVIKLSESGAFLWNRLAEGASREELISAMLSEYEVDPSRAAHDIDIFLNKLKEADLLA